VAASQRTIVATACIALWYAASACSPSSPSDSTPVATLIVAGTPPPLGTSSQFAAIAVRQDGSSQPVTEQATWRSSNTAVATVSAGGMVAAVSVGSVDITAAYSNARGSLQFTVAPAVTFTIRGIVTDAVSASGIGAATVTVKAASGSSVSAMTDNVGRYVISGLAGDNEDVTAQAPAHVPVTRTTRILSDATLDFVLPRAAPCPLIGFDDLQINGRSLETYTACGFTITPTTTNWTVSTAYGRPAPFILFNSSGGITSTGEIVVTNGGAKFMFVSVDVYSSTTPIPYVITGLANSAPVLSIQNTQGNTFGAFATVFNPRPATPVDALLIRLTNPANPCPPCGSNPMGLDNIQLAR